MEVLLNTLADKKDLIHAGNATTMFKDVLGDTIKIVGIITYKKQEVNENTGEVSTKVVSCVKKDDGEFVSSISPTVQNSLSLIYSAYSSEEIAAGVDIVIKSKKSNGKRDFIYIDIA